MDAATNENFALGERAVLRFQLAVVFVLVALSTSIRAALLTFGNAFGLIRPADSLLFLDGEMRVPAFYSSLALGACSALLFLSAGGATSDRDRSVWRMLGAVFFGLSLDEALAVHERAIEPLRTALEIESGPLWFAWIIPASLMVVILGLATAGFVWRREPGIRNRFLLSAALFIGGALGVEAVGGWIVAGPSESEQFMTWSYLGVVTLEESLEMLGVAVFSSALVRQLASTSTGREITIEFVR